MSYVFYVIFTITFPCVNKKSLGLDTLLFIVLEDGLSKNFVNAEVRVVECPDLTLEPFNVAAKG